MSENCLLDLKTRKNKVVSSKNLLDFWKNTLKPKSRIFTIYACLYTVHCSLSHAHCKYYIQGKKFYKCTYLLSKRQKSSVVKSPLSVFKNLSRSKNLPSASASSAAASRTTTSQTDKHNQPPQPQQHPAPPSIAPSEVTGPCESPYPVSNFFKIFLLLNH